ncbi:hypothetical protein [Morganella psychrotolerans]|uniref:hypothetical protein n=1 Tax=Morganella psychrotolerans TaxID=368603 RepID=UPI0039AF53FD
MWNIHPTREEFELLSQYLSPLEARIEAGLLESEGIKVMLLDENIVWNNQMYAQAVGGVKLLVSHDDAEKAQSVLDELHRGAYGIDDDGEPAEAEPCAAVKNRAGDHFNTGFVFLIFLTLGLALPFKALHRHLRDKKEKTE